MRKSFHNEKGLTLVEVLASIVILSIVITTFLLIFTQTAKTTIQSEETIDATYIAQTEMENLYEMSRDYTLSKTYLELINEEYRETAGKPEWDSFEKSILDENEKLHIFLHFKEADNGMTRVLIEVKNTAQDERTKAQMENLYQWKD